MGCGDSLTGVLVRRAQAWGCGNKKAAGSSPREPYLVDCEDGSSHPLSSQLIVQGETSAMVLRPSCGKHWPWLGSRPICHPSGRQEDNSQALTLARLMVTGS